MNRTAPSERPPLTTYHYVILGFQLVVAAIVGVLPFFTGGDSDGFGDLVRVVGLVMMSLWIAGVALSWAVARYFVTSPWTRSGIVLGMPGLGVIVFILLARA